MMMMMISLYKTLTNDNSTLLNNQKYKMAIKKNLIHRAFYMSSSQAISYKELTNLKQTLVNNNFPNKLVDQQLKQYRHNIHKNNYTTNDDNTNRINLHCRNQMHYNYK